jgi:hypothetical protein
MAGKYIIPKIAAWSTGFENDGFGRASHGLHSNAGRLSYTWTSIVNVAYHGSISSTPIIILTFEGLSASMADTGLQPLNAFLIFFPFIISLAVVVIRVWRRTIEHQFAIGKTSELTRWECRNADENN